MLPYDADVTPSDFQTSDTRFNLIIYMAEVLNVMW